jgi:6-phosphofructokinase
MAGLEGKVLVAQGGGPTAVINQSLVGAVLESRKFPQVTRVYGAIHGVSGILKEDFLDLTEATTHNLEIVAKTPSSALLSTRDKPDVEYCKKIFEVCKAHGVRYFFYIGGNDSADTCRIVNEESNKAGYELRVIHIPKTIDNDLRSTDHCPGYGSAARFVAQAFAGANLDNRSLPGVYIAVVMGRHAGFLTAASCLAKKYPDDGPHLIYLPERPFTKEKFLADVKRNYDEYGRCIVAVSEGVVGPDGKAVVAQFTGGERDAHGNVQLSGTGALGDLLSSWVKNELNIKRVRSDTFGYLQRSFLGCVSPVDQQEAREVGEKAAHYAIWHNQDGSVAMRRVGDYAVEYFLAKLSDAARETKHMADEFINAEGNYVTEAFRNYVRPLVGELPLMDRISAPRVKKILNRVEAAAK